MSPFLSIPHPFRIFALPLKHGNASVYLWSPLAMNPFKGDAKDVFLGASALRDGYLHLVPIIVFSNKTSGKKNSQLFIKNGLNVFLFTL